VILGACAFSATCGDSNHSTMGTSGSSPSLGVKAPNDLRVRGRRAAGGARDKVRGLTNGADCTPMSGGLVPFALSARRSLTCTATPGHRASPRCARWPIRGGHAVVRSGSNRRGALIDSPEESRQPDSNATSRDDARRATADDGTLERAAVHKPLDCTHPRRTGLRERWHDLPLLSGVHTMVYDLTFCTTHDCTSVHYSASYACAPTCHGAGTPPENGTPPNQI